VWFVVVRIACKYVGEQNVTMFMRGFTNDTQLFLFDQTTAPWPFAVLRALGTFQVASDVLRFGINETRMTGGYASLQLIKTVEGVRINHTRNDLLYFHPLTALSCLSEGLWFAAGRCTACPIGGTHLLCLHLIAACACAAAAAV